MRYLSAVAKYMFASVPEARTQRPQRNSQRKIGWERIAPQEKKAVEYSADVHAKPHSKSWAAQLTSEDAERAEGKAQKRKEKKAG